MNSNDANDDINLVNDSMSNCREIADRWICATKLIVVCATIHGLDSSWLQTLIHNTTNALFDRATHKQSIHDIRECFINSFAANINSNHNEERRE